MSLSFWRHFKNLVTPTIILKLNPLAGGIHSTRDSNITQPTTTVKIITTCSSVGVWDPQASLSYQINQWIPCSTELMVQMQLMTDTTVWLPHIAQTIQWINSHFQVTFSLLYFSCLIWIIKLFSFPPCWRASFKLQQYSGFLWRQALNSSCKQRNSNIFLWPNGNSFGKFVSLLQFQFRPQDTSSVVTVLFYYFS